MPEIMINISNTQQAVETASQLQVMCLGSIKELQINDEGHIDGKFCFLPNVTRKGPLIFAIAKGYRHCQTLPILPRAIYSLISANNQKVIIDALLANENIAEFINMQDDRGNTALHIACMHHDPELINLLISKGADVRQKNIHGQTPLELLQHLDYFDARMFLAEYTGCKFSSIAKPYTFTIADEETWSRSLQACMHHLEVAQALPIDELKMQAFEDESAAPYAGLSISCDKFEDILSRFQSTNKYFRPIFIPEMKELYKLLLRNRRHAKDSITFAEACVSVGLAQDNYGSDMVRALDFTRSIRCRDRMRSTGGQAIVLENLRLAFMNPDYVYNPKIKSRADRLGYR